MIRIAIAGKGGVGKTLTAAGIAQTFAQSGKRTLAIDADPSPNLAPMLGLSAAETEKILPISRNEDLIRTKTETRFPGVYNLNFTVDNLFDYTPKNYYWSSAMTTGRTFTVGLSIDIDRFVKVF